MEFKVKKYKSYKGYRADLGKMWAKGWSVQEIDRQQRKKGCRSWLFLGIFNIFRKGPSDILYVTYERER